MGDRSELQHNTLLAIETLSLEMQRLGAAVRMVGEGITANGCHRTDGGGVEILGEAIFDKGACILDLVKEGLGLAAQST